MARAPATTEVGDHVGAAAADVPVTPVRGSAGRAPPVIATVIPLGLHGVAPEAPRAAAPGQGRVVPSRPRKTTAAVGVAATPVAAAPGRVELVQGRAAARLAARPAVEPEAAREAGQTAAPWPTAVPRLRAVAEGEATHAGVPIAAASMVAAHQAGPHGPAPEGAATRRRPPVVLIPTSAGSATVGPPVVPNQGGPVVALTEMEVGPPSSPVAARAVAKARRVGRARPATATAALTAAADTRGGAGVGYPARAIPAPRAPVTAEKVARPFWATSGRPAHGVAPYAVPMTACPVPAKIRRLVARRSPSGVAPLARDAAPPRFHVVGEPVTQAARVALALVATASSREERRDADSRAGRVGGAEAESPNGG